MKHSFACTLAALGLAAAGCASQDKLEPAATAMPAPGVGDAAIAQASGVAITASANAWRGAEVVNEAMTPIRVGIENNSGRPLWVRLDALTLSSDEGERVAAIAPQNVQATIMNYRIAGPVPPHVDTGGHKVSPEFSTSHSRHPIPSTGYVAPVERRYSADPADISTDELARSALREGTIPDGGRASGFVYFADLPLDAERATLHYQLIDASTGAAFGSIAIPFVVD